MKDRQLKDEKSTRKKCVETVNRVDNRVKERRMEKIPQMSNWSNYKIKDRLETEHEGNPLEWSVDTTIIGK